MTKPPQSVIVEWQSVDPGYRHVCALSTDGDIGCWGDNHFGQLGRGVDYNALPYSGEPMLNMSEKKWKAVASGGDFSCAITEADAVECWGSNQRRQLGMSEVTPFSATPVAVNLGGGKVLSISTGGAHACSIAETPPIVAGGAAKKTIWCWGDDANRQTSGYSGTPVGQTGVDPTVVKNFAPKPEDPPRPFEDITDWSEVVAGALTTCALSPSAGVWCWGYNQPGTAGFPPSNAGNDVPGHVSFATTDSIVDIDLDGNRGCAITSNAKLHCWGRGGSGELGVNLRLDAIDPVLAVRCTNEPVFCANPIEPFPSRIWSHLEVGPLVVCAKDELANTVCFGNNSGGQGAFGNGLWQLDTSVSNPAKPVIVTQLQLGQTGTLALGGRGRTDVGGAGQDGAADLSCMLLDKKISCWGDNRFGQLGNGTASQTATPTEVLPLNVSGQPAKSWKKLHANGNSTCAIDSDDDLFCWGDDGERALSAEPNPPQGSYYKVPKQIEIEPGTKFKEVFVTAGWMCAVTTDGKVFCSGDGDAAIFATTDATPAPLRRQIRFENDQQIEQLQGGYLGICAQTASDWFCWGTVHRAFQRPTLVDPNPPPAAFPRAFDDDYAPESLQNSLPEGVSATDVSSISFGPAATAAVVDGYGMFGIGNTWYGLGRNGGECSTPPCRLASQLSLHFGISTAGGGSDLNHVESVPRGPLAFRDTNNQQVAFQSIQLSQAYVNTACGLTSGGKVYCWGSNRFRQTGALGSTPNEVLAEMITRPTEAQVTKNNPRTCSDIAINGFFACAVCKDTGSSPEQIQCWGDKSAQQLGKDPEKITTDTDYPQQINLETPDGLPWKKLSLGFEHGCVLSQNGRIFCWGNSSRGQLGIGASSENVPVPILEIMK
jgi:alpha-tubulin suppressor-like RCC1 family protein